MCTGGSDDIFSINEAINSIVWNQHVKGKKHIRNIQRMDDNTKGYRPYECEICSKNGTVIFCDEAGYFDHLAKHTFEETLPEEFKTSIVKTEEERINEEQEKIQMNYVTSLEREIMESLSDDDLLYSSCEDQ